MSVTTNTIGINLPLERQHILEQSRCHAIGYEGGPLAFEIESLWQCSVRQRLSQHEYPRLIEFVAELPKTPAGKVNRKVLRAREQGASTKAA